MSTESPSPGSAPGPVSLRVCPTCGAEYPLATLFCPRDGASLAGQGAGNDLIGTVIAERYHVLERIGEGGMGRVYRAEHIAMGRECALKILHPSLRPDADAVARFRREAANAGRIHHPHVVGVYDCGETADRLIYLAMEYVPGESLGSVIKRSAPLAPARAVRIALQVSSALAAAHKLGIIHRDLKPDNIIISTSPEGEEVAKVVDFGIAKATRADSASQAVTRTGFVVGTFQYMSPEQMMGEAVDQRSDVYGLGCIVYEMLVGRRLFEGSTGESALTNRLTQPPPHPREANPAIPAALDALVVKMLARSRDDRFQATDELRAALLALPDFGAAPTAPAVRSTAPAVRSTAPAPPSGTARAARTSTVEAIRIVAADIANDPVKRRRAGVGAAAAIVVATLGILAATSSDGQPASGPVPPDTTVVAEPDTVESPAPPVVVDHPVPAVLTLRPGQTFAGAAGGLLLRVSGRDFVSGAVVQWDGEPRPTNYVGPTELQARIAPADLARAGRVAITVFNPAPGGGESQPVGFRIDAAPAPVPPPERPPDSTRSPPAPRVPTAEELEGARTLLRVSRTNARDGDFTAAFRNLNLAEQLIAQLRQAYPQSTSVRALGDDHVSAINDVRQACANVRAVTGQTPSGCS